MSIVLGIVSRNLRLFFRAASAPCRPSSMTARPGASPTFWWRPSAARTSCSGISFLPSSSRAFTALAAFGASFLLRRPFTADALRTVTAGDAAASDSLRGFYGIDLFVGSAQVARHPPVMRPASLRGAARTMDPS